MTGAPCAHGLAASLPGPPIVACASESVRQRASEGRLAAICCKRPDPHRPGSERRSFTGDLDRGAWFAVTSPWRSPQIVPATGPTRRCRGADRSRRSLDLSQRAAVVRLSEGTDRVASGGCGFARAGGGRLSAGMARVLLPGCVLQLVMGSAVGCSASLLWGGCTGVGTAEAPRRRIRRRGWARRARRTRRARARG